MSLYLSSVVSHFLLLAVFMGLFWSDTEKRYYRLQFGLFIAAVVIGALLYQWLPYSQIYVLFISACFAGALVLLALIRLIIRLHPKILLLWQSALTLLASFMWAREAKLGMLSATSVINTDFVLNIFALIGGFILIVVGQLLTTHLLAPRSKIFKQLLRWVLLIIALLPLSGELLLAGMKLQYIGLYRELLSYVSKVTNFYWVYAYAVVVISVIAAIVYWLKNMRPLKVQWQSQPAGVARRKIAARYRQHQQLFSLYAVTFALILACLSYWDLVASRPPTLSPAATVTLGDDASVHIPVNKQLMDGKLHRYQWIASDGKVVRFFIIDRYPGQAKFGVVFDACRLCGDAGYIQQGEQVICLACGVHIFIPSIGKAGGCNPIPIEKWQLKNNEVVISEKMLETGLQFFSQVVEITATDPVSGDKLSNLKAPFNYMYAGKTYFFSSESSYERFREDPQRYIGEGN